MAVDNQSLEQIFEQLEDTIARLEAKDVTLEESFAAYKEGMELLKQCNSTIDQVEKQVLLISENGDLIPFDKDGRSEK